MQILKRITIGTLLILWSFSVTATEKNTLLNVYSVLVKGDTSKNSEKQLVWKIDTQADWATNTDAKTNLLIADGKITPIADEAFFRSSIKKLKEKTKISSITLSQSPVWQNWKPVPRVGPANLGDAPVALQMGDGNYWMFGRYTKTKSQREGTFKAENATLKGYDIALKTTPHKNQYDAPGGLKPGKQGYHAWQSKDMKNWVHHGPVSEKFSRWMTTAEYVDGKVYLYYDFPNDQDPHVYIDEDLTDGEPGKNMGLAFKDPSDGSDCAIIRDLEGKFHIIAEDWSVIHAQSRSWDSPLAVHAVSEDGLNDFKIVDPPIDETTNPTGETGTYTHPHWVKEDPKNFKSNVAKYEIHSPEQHAFGDWASISIGGQYYLFGDFDPAGKHGREHMSVAWFTSDDINKQFTFCDNIGQGHPDPDIMFAEGKFYMFTQTASDYVSSGPWVETVEVRVGVDSTNDGKIDSWNDWQVVTEQYDYIDGFAKQVKRIPATLNLAELPEGFGFQFEIRLKDSTENKSIPIIDQVKITF